ncbi:MAG: hypothetical protein JW963_24730, partial [Anaerolineales bacterium]|nr:hypothetical protein [Anaerolineales bacterium]
MLREFYKQRIKRGLVRRLNNLKIAAVARRVARQEPQPSGAPVAFFKASTGIDDLSWNSGFHLLASWALRLKGVPVAYFACNAGMSHCVLGTNRDNPKKEPPCKSCVYQSKSLYSDVPSHAVHRTTHVNWFNFQHDESLSKAVAGLSVPELMRFEWKLEYKGVVASEAKQSPENEEIALSQRTLLATPPNFGGAMTLPLGALCLPGLRWILRIHHLSDDENTRYLLREYILSAWNIARKFADFLERTRPRAVIVFNGQFYPEATARYIAQKRGIRVITHEVGLQPASAFFTEGEATAYPIRIPDEFELNEEQNARLDAYLAKRFQGDFSMAGVRFWPEIKRVSQEFLEKAANFQQIVPVFTNVVFDTSQGHANVIFDNMFEWLDVVLEIIISHPETLFVLRAHPDELRPGKESQETVAGWVEKTQAASLPNVIFYDAQVYISSYDLIKHAKLVMVYNSTIGLEASVMGAAVLCGGKARFTQIPTVFYPHSVQEYLQRADEMLAANV